MLDREPARIKAIANKIVFTPNMTALELIDEIGELSDETVINGSLGLLIRSLVYEVRTKVKS